MRTTLYKRKFYIFYSFEIINFDSYHCLKRYELSLVLNEYIFLGNLYLELKN